MRHGPRRETRAKHEQAATLRACGYTWQSIADHLGYRHRQAAKTAVERLYARTRETPEVSRRSLADGMRLTQTVLFESLAEAKKRDDVAAITAISRELRSTSDRIAKLDGLDAPERVQVQVTQTLDEGLAAVRKALMDTIEANELARPAIEGSQAAARFVQSERVQSADLH